MPIMRPSKRHPLAFALFTALNITPVVQAACVSLSALDNAYTQNFDTLATAGTTNALGLDGWSMTETGGGTRDNEQYAADTGASNTGDTYSYGAAGSAERALGGLRSGTLIPVFGACFTNDTGATINTFAIAYNGEQWRLGTAARTDQINFEYSTNATDLATGTWTGASGLNFVTPNTATTGAKDGNASGNRTAISANIASLSIAPGGTFWLRWTDTDATGADDGLAVDDFSLTPSGNVVTTPTVNLSVSANTGSEAAATAVTVTVTASAAVVGDQTVTLAVSGTDITTGDYTLSNTVITIPNGSTTGSVTFTVVDDALVEVTETASLTISDPTAGISLGTTTAQTIAITDNDIAPGSTCGDPATKISAVQGNGASTPLSGVTSIEGIVVGDYQGTSTNSLRGYFVQEEDSDVDANHATSEGIFVFDGTTALANVSVGDRVRVTGTPAEFFGMTQIGSVTDVKVCTNSQAIPTAATLTLPVPNIPNGNLANATAAINAYYEAFEGMLVKFPTTLKVSEYFELERYGQLVLSQGGRIPTFTSVSNPNVTGLVDQEITLAKRQIILDDGNNSQNFALTSGLPLPYPTGGLSISNRFRGGDIITNLTGVLHWSFAGLTGTDAWRIRPVEELIDYNFTPANPRKPVVPTVGGNLKVASFNVLNYFTTIDETASTTSGPCGPDGIQDCRGADSAAELTRQTEKAAIALCGIGADIVGMMEIENNATTSLSVLVAAANAISGCGPYDFINAGIIGNSSTTGDAIKVGLLYKTASVAPVGSHAILTTSVDVRFIDTKNRPTLAQTFSQISTGEKLTVAVNHLKSKGSDCLDVGDADLNDGQGNCSQTRKNAALAMVDWLNSDPTNSGDPDFLIIGDLNSYAKEDAIKAIENGSDDASGTFDDYINLVKAFGGDSAYSYVFDGQTGYLDHALANITLLPQVTGAGDWHINADEPPSFDYNDTIRDTGEASFEAKPAALPLYAANQFRTSDHDPVVIGLQLGETINIVEGTAARNSLVGSAGKDRITGFVGADTLSGGLNEDEFVYVTTGDGIDTIIDFAVGEDKIVLTALLQSLGYQGADPLADGIVKFAASGSNTVLYIDTDGAGPAVQRALAIINNVTALNLNNAANFIF
ncbi:extracellular nuclease [Methyloglobulus morosus KoM1]|uniref:Extracellular nuclease n=1 Tax=Methyloglobulus morosus KoM1 TaxID=1116472 RepID=V5DVL9_9GAMM|nr:ExeM/NucH family extracellular endonuclease [Methyloglobulus morosus]ESS71426.1 extracellular nuclease [Methyloglobulus morosus KoM1]